MQYGDQHIQTTSDCASHCVETLAYCLQQGGAYAGPKPIMLLTDCSEICRVCTSFLLRDSEKSREVCSLAADICDQCAEALETFTGDARMRGCAESCRSCAASCKEMAGMIPTA